MQIFLREESAGLTICNRSLTPLFTLLVYRVGKNERLQGSIAEEGAHQDTAVVQIDGRLHDPSEPARTLHTFGTAHCGLETMRHAWPTLRHKFSAGGSQASSASTVFRGSRPARTVLNHYPVDLLVVDLGSANSSGSGRNYPWKEWVELADNANRPEVVLESWPPMATTWTTGPLSKGRRTGWKNLGYTSRYHLMDSRSHGGAINQTRLMVARVRADRDSGWKWPQTTKAPHPRPMGNLLTPFGLLPRHVRRSVERTPRPSCPSSDLDAMPNCLGARISTPHGTRRLQADELARGLGCPNLEVKGLLSITQRALQCTTSLFIWEALSNTLNQAAAPPLQPVALHADWARLEPSQTAAATPRNTAHTHETQPAPPPFSWEPPDLTEGGKWHAARVNNLRAAAEKYGTEANAIIEDGLRRLEIHRGNYDVDGPAVRQLQLLWWEFPPEHWDALREGSRVGFLSEPPSVHHQNSDMDDEQLRVAAQFVDELLDVGAIGPPPPGSTPVTNTPLFCVPKPHQEDEWRVIADCKAGGQNDHVGADPVYLNRPLHILEQMCEGGYTVVADASKFFYQFPVHPDDQKYLGIIHPVTGAWCVWKGCPMGSGSSPGLAGRYGLAFVRMLRERSEWFRGQGKANCYWTELRDEGYDPARGYGFTLVRSDGSPAVRIWVFVDDFALHGPDWHSTSQALKDFLDLAVDVGLLIHPKKLHPPSQVQQYIGFIFDTRSSPVLRIPVDKIERSLAMAQYVNDHPPHKPFSRLALSVVAGTLESVADATPNRLGHTYLRATHALIHPEGHDPGREVYYTTCTISDSVRREMRWWLSILADDNGRGLRSGRSSTLVPTWGDGSGTGTGGTILLPNQPLHLWMGQWSPTVYHHSSNWKELKTLLLTLQQLAAHRHPDLRGTTVFYFTDNSATYYITSGGSSRSPGLHALVEQIQLLVLQLGCHLEVVHVPGVVMIRQGTDGLSRGVWLSSMHPERNQTELTAAVFAPMVPDMELAFHYASRMGYEGPIQLHDWHQPWGRDLFDHLSVWFPPPELARQCLIGILEAWVERPHTTSALILVPRTLSRCWLGLSRYIQLIDTIYPAEFPLRHPPMLPIPILVLYIPPHTPSLPSTRGMGPSTKPTGFRWHDGEAARMRGLPRRDPSELRPSPVPLP